MSRYFSYISSAVVILETYTGEEPFVHFARKKFAANKKFGSRDRKTISSLCYSYFRTAHLFAGDTPEEKILKSLFLCESENNPVLAALKPEWNGMVTLPKADKLSYLSADALKLFPFSAELGSGINPGTFALSFLTQPLLYLRIRPGKNQKVIAALDTAGIPYRSMGENCLALSNATSLELVLRLNKDVVVQDFNSQKVFLALENEDILDRKSRGVEVWDCCAASGGKSLLLYDTLQGNMKLTASDIRSSILANLKTRLQQAGVPLYKTFVADLAVSVPAGVGSFDIVICDVPCTGSGTWSRTPEQLAFFKKENIAAYSQKQEKIAANASALLGKAGLFFYITCSVFRQENEDVVAYLQETCALDLVSTQYLEGYEMQADTMFVAVFTKPSLEEKVPGHQ